LPCFDPKTGQNDLNPLTQHQGGRFWTKPNSLEDKSDKKCTWKCSPRTNWNEVLTELGPENQNWRYAVSSHTLLGVQHVLVYVNSQSALDPGFEQRLRRFSQMPVTFIPYWFGVNKPPCPHLSHKQAKTTIYFTHQRALQSGFLVLSCDVDEWLQLPLSKPSYPQEPLILTAVMQAGRESPHTAALGLLETRWGPANAEERGHLFCMLRAETPSWKGDRCKQIVRTKLASGLDIPMCCPRKMKGKQLCGSIQLKFA
jgi:hypothetical protein